MLLDKNTQDSDTDTGSVSRDNDTTVPDANAETTQPVVHVGDHSIDMLIMLFIALASCVVVVLILLRHNRVNGD